MRDSLLRGILIWSLAKIFYRSLVRALEFSVSVSNRLVDGIHHPSYGIIPDDYLQAGRVWLAEIRYRF